MLRSDSCSPSLRKRVEAFWLPESSLRKAYRQRWASDASLEFSLLQPSSSATRCPLPALGGLSLLGRQIAAPPLGYLRTRSLHTRVVNISTGPPRIPGTDFSGVGEGREASLRGSRGTAATQAATALGVGRARGLPGPDRSLSTTARGCGPGRRGAADRRRAGGSAERPVWTPRREGRKTSGRKPRGRPLLARDAGA